MISVSIRTPADVGALIRARRKQRGLDQAELAAMAGVSRLWINQVERGKPGASLGLVLRTLAVLDAPLLAPEPAQNSANPAAPPAGPDIGAIIERARRGIAR